MAYFRCVTPNLPPPRVCCSDVFCVYSPTIFSWKNYLHPKNEWEVLQKRPTFWETLGHLTDHIVLCT